MRHSTPERNILSFQSQRPSPSSAATLMVKSAVCLGSGGLTYACIFYFLSPDICLSEPQACAHASTIHRPPRYLLRQFRPVPCWFIGQWLCCCSPLGNTVYNQPRTAEGSSRRANLSLLFVLEMRWEFYMAIETLIEIKVYLSPFCWSLY